MRAACVHNQAVSRKIIVFPRDRRPMPVETPLAVPAVSTAVQTCLNHASQVRKIRAVILGAATRFSPPIH